MADTLQKIQSVLDGITANFGGKLVVITKRVKRGTERLCSRGET